MISINDIVSVVERNNPDASVESILKSYELAEYAHNGVYRESGEPYIVHPLNVANNLLNMEVYDCDTICAALLHDTVEDNDEISLELIAEQINPVVAELVDGVTKMRRMNYSSKSDQNNANTRKIINGLNKDVRIILIKLADRLHNMQTLQFKKPEKQRENSTETMELFVPLALSIGAYRIKGQLEDLSLMYIEPDVYKRIVEKRDLLAQTEKEYLNEIKYKIECILKEKDIPNDIIIRTKNVCTIYKKIMKGYIMENIYDLFYLKILVDEIDDCYRTLSYVHRNNPPINGRFKDYIYNPRTNHYQSLHTTVSGDGGKLIKTKIRTFDMDKVAAFGISAYWNINPNEPAGEEPLRRNFDETQNHIREKLQFAVKLQEIDSVSTDDSRFIEVIKHDLLSEHVYVYKHTGEVIELPQGSTALDFVCQVYPEMLDKMTGVIVNGKQSSVHRELKNNDRVQISTDGLVDHKGWENAVTTFGGRAKIYTLINRQKSNQVL